MKHQQHLKGAKTTSTSIKSKPGQAGRRVAVIPLYRGIED